MYVITRKKKNHTRMSDTRCSDFISRWLMPADSLFYVAGYLISACCSLPISSCLLLLTRYTLLTEFLAARLSLPADSRTLPSDCCCSTTIERSSHH